MSVEATRPTDDWAAQEDLRTRQQESTEAPRVVTTSNRVSDDPAQEFVGAQLSATRLDEAHGRLALSKEHTVVRGVPTCRVNGADVSNVVLLTDQVFVDGVGVTVDGVLVARGCVFTKPVTVAAGGKAHFVGCVFADEAHVDNAGVAGNAYVTSCHRSSGVAHVNVTTQGETT